ncbi:hypothetical protein TRIATDRAFT_299578 [Trichoderma atroviride IMI 206040]|uniref:Secreted protein n=1 Tax=Hypocrea atroviridis (strain ATCC 20476 / IMI 206040) TaxID=452589 RepID=G9NTY3_HYPAI|nr:uncharacterized protein TRIATDRAFT_299578 [Trichoderma atroviride IMI 206040]EHK46170.1 hypothetical protein TRIATDRAFT_299578 [Trichoderma atroviride IMI 206040]
MALFFFFFFGFSARLTTLQISGRVCEIDISPGTTTLGCQHARYRTMQSTQLIWSMLSQPLYQLIQSKRTSSKKRQSTQQ